MALKLLQPDLSDIDFICELMLDAARHGHFNDEILKESYEQALRHDIEYLLAKGRRRDEDLRAQAIIIEDDGNRIGFAIMSEMYEGDGGNELYILAVAPEYRGRGYGAQILDELLDRWLPHAEVFAQCLPASETMYQMLLKRGFSHVKTTDDGTRLMRSGKAKNK